MSNFAERLAARGAGAPPGPGISLLTPRPASRFETVASVDIETDAGLKSAEGSIATRPATGLETDAVSAPAPAQTRAEWDDTRNPLDNRSVMLPQRREDTVQRPRYTAHIARPETQEEVTPVPPSDAGERRLNPIATNPDANEAHSERHEVSKAREPADALRPEIPERSVHSELAAVPADHRQRSERTPPLVASNQPRETAPIREIESDRPPAPAISIGKIEVQFLPQEPRVAPRPQPQRTRGFEAYARARRGEPR